MKHLPTILLLSTALTLSACGQAGEQWMNPDTTFSLFDQPDVKGIDDTQADMAVEASAQGEFARAAQIYEQIIARGKAAPEKMFGYKLAMTDAIRRLGDAPKSLTMYEELAKEKPDNLDVKEGRALALMGAGKTEDAGRVFSEIMEKDPKRWRTLNAIGILFVTKNMIPEAIQYYSEALEYSPENAAVLNNVGLSYAIDRNFTRSIAALEQAAQFSKSARQRKQAELNLAMVLGVSGDMERAKEVAGKYFEGPALDNNLGLYAHLAKNSVLAKTYLNMALSQSPVFYERAWENLDAVVSDPRWAESAKTKKLAAPVPAKPPQKEIAADDGPQSKPVKALKPEEKPEQAAPAAGNKVLPKLPKAKAESVVDRSTKPLPKLNGAGADAKSTTPKAVEKKPAEKPIESATEEKKKPEPKAEEDQKKPEAVAREPEKKPEAPESQKKPETAAAKAPEEAAKEKPPELIVGPSEGD